MSERQAFPWAAAMAFLSFLLASGLIVAGVHQLAGEGWALLAGAVPFVLLSAIILRGLR